MAKRTAGAKALQRSSVWCVHEAGGQRSSGSRVNQGEGWYGVIRSAGRDPTEPKARGKDSVFSL